MSQPIWDSQLLGLERRKPEHLSVENRELSTLTQTRKKHNKQVLQRLARSQAKHCHAGIQPSVARIFFLRIEILTLKFLTFFFNN